MSKLTHFSNETSEKAFIACLLKKPSLLGRLPEIVNVNDFFHNDYGDIYSSIIPYMNKNTLDINLLLSKSNLNREIIEELYSYQVDISNIEIYARKVIEASTKRQILKTVDYVKERLLDQKAISTVVGELEKGIFQAVQRSSIQVAPISED